MFEEMISIANNKLSTVDETVESLPAPQVTVLLSAKNHIYAAVNDTDGTLCEECSLNQDTTITKMLTMWKGGKIDLPSIKFRKALVEMNDENNNTNVLLQWKEKYLIKRLSATLI